MAQSRVEMPKQIREDVDGQKLLEVSWQYLDGQKEEARSHEFPRVFFVKSNTAPKYKVMKFRKYDAQRLSAARLVCFLLKLTTILVLSLLFTSSAMPRE